MLYLSPYYKLLNASGMHAAQPQLFAPGPDRAAEMPRTASSFGSFRTMFDELSSRFREVGVRVTDNAEQSYSEDGRALMLLVLCPGFFSCAELVEETAQALRAMNARAPALPSRGSSPALCSRGSSQQLSKDPRPGSGGSPLEATDAASTSPPSVSSPLRKLRTVGWAKQALSSRTATPPHSIPEATLFEEDEDEGGVLRSRPRACSSTSLRHSLRSFRSSSGNADAGAPVRRASVGDAGLGSLSLSGRLAEINADAPPTRPRAQSELPPRVSVDLTSKNRISDVLQASIPRSPTISRDLQLSGVIFSGPVCAAGLPRVPRHATGASPPQHGPRTVRLERPRALGAVGR